MKRFALIILAILGFMLLFALRGCIFPDVTYENTHPSFYYLATAEHLYLLAAIQKREERERQWFMDPHFCYSYPKQLLYLLDISAVGGCRAFSFVPPKVMSGAITACEINLAKCHKGLVLFDYETEYWFDGEEFGGVPSATATLLADVFDGHRGRQFNNKPLEEWNSAHGVIASGRVPGREWDKYLQLDWKQHHFEFTRTDTWPQFYQMTISAPTLWQSDLLMKVQYDKLSQTLHSKEEPGFSPVEIVIPSPLGTTK